MTETNLTRHRRAAKIRGFRDRVSEFEERRGPLARRSEFCHRT